MNFFSNNLKFLREKKGLEQLELAKMLGKKSSSSISEWESGRYTPKAGTLSDIAEIFNVTLSDLMQVDLANFTEHKQNNITEKKPVNFDSIKIPFFGSVAAGALAVVDGVTEESIEHITISKRLLGKYANSTDMFAMHVNGDSMNKVIKNGEIVIAKQQDLEDYHDGDIVIFSHQNEYSLKRFAPNDIEGFVLFKSESYDMSFKDIPIPRDTDQDLKIYGKVVFCGSTF